MAGAARVRCGRGVRGRRLLVDEGVGDQRRRAGGVSGGPLVVRGEEHVARRGRRCEHRADAPVEGQGVVDPGALVSRPHERKDPPYLSTVEREDAFVKYIKIISFFYSEIKNIEEKGGTAYFAAHISLRSCPPDKDKGGFLLSSLLELISLRNPWAFQAPLYMKSRTIKELATLDCSLIAIIVSLRYTSSRHPLFSSM